MLGPCSAVPARLEIFRQELVAVIPVLQRARRWRRGSTTALAWRGSSPTGLSRWRRRRWSGGERGHGRACAATSASTRPSGGSWSARQRRPPRSTGGDGAPAEGTGERSVEEGLGSGCVGRGEDGVGAWREEGMECGCVGRSGGQARVEDSGSDWLGARSSVAGRGGFTKGAW